MPLVHSTHLNVTCRVGLVGCQNRYLGRAICTSKTIRTELGLTTGYRIYARPSHDGSEPYSARLWSRAERGSAYSAPAAPPLRFSGVNFVCWLLSGVCSTPELPQWHVKDPGHSGKSSGGRLHLNTRTPLTQQSRIGLTMPLCRHSVGTYPETNLHAICQGTLGHSCLSSPSHCGLILA